MNIFSKAALPNPQNFDIDKFNSPSSMILQGDED
jgi:hypothetical protein